MGTFIAFGLMGLLLLWLLGVGRRAPTHDPMDEFEGVSDEAELEEAELEVRDDPNAKPASEVVDDDDEDWGPGSGHSPMPGVL
jgi:hypothetical protein